jgi:hypothetical protein
MEAIQLFRGFINDEFGKDLGGSGYGLTHVQRKHLPGGTETNHRTPQPGKRILRLHYYRSNI